MVIMSADFLFFKNLLGHLTHLILLMIEFQTLRIAIETYRRYKSSWEGIMKRGMIQNYTWDNAASQYEQVFEWAMIDSPYVP